MGSDLWDHTGDDPDHHLTAPPGSLKTILDLLVWLIGFFVLGLFAARQTGRVGTGALVGLVTGLIGGLIGRVLFVRDRLIDVHSS